MTAVATARVVLERRELLEVEKSRLLDAPGVTRMLRAQSASRRAISELLGTAHWGVERAYHLDSGISNLKIAFDIVAEDSSRATVLLKRYFDFFAGDPRHDYGAVLTHRLQREAAALRLFGGRVGWIRVPRLLASSPRQCWNLLEAVPRPQIVGQLSTTAARRLGESLAVLHARPGFPRRLSTPALIEDAVAYRLEVGGAADLQRRECEALQGLLAGPRARGFVHGDACRKNLLRAEDTGRMWLLDFEQATIGDVVMDLGFLAADLILSSFERLLAGHRSAAPICVAALVEGHRRRSRILASATHERQFVAHIVTAMLYRSRTIHYLPPPHAPEVTEYLRNAALSMLGGGVSNLDALTRSLAQCHA